MKFQNIEQLKLNGQRLFIRCDLNVPIADGVITNDARIKASIPTIRHALDHQAKVIVCSHFGRPTAGVFDPVYSLSPVAKRLSELLGSDVDLVQTIENTSDLQNGRAVLLENIRFEIGEIEDDVELAKRLADHVDVYCNDAFGTAHRAHVSTHGLAHLVKTKCAGLLLSQELESLGKILENPARPLVAVIGGAKVSGKLEVLHNLMEIADTVIVGGGMANTFLLASGSQIGASLCEPELVDEAKSIMVKGDLPLPIDVMVTNELEASANSSLRLINDVAENHIIADIGPSTARAHAETLKTAGTILWNGPMGVFEFTQFGEGTRVIGEAIAESSGYSVAGGGDTVAAIEKYELANQIDYISTGGGAFLEFIEGRQLPGIAALEITN